MQSFQEAGQALEPLRKPWANHITYMGGELTPSGMTSLKPEAEKLNAQGSHGLADGPGDREGQDYFQRSRPQRAEPVAPV